LKYYFFALTLTNSPFTPFRKGFPFPHKPMLLKGGLLSFILPPPTSIFFGISPVPTSSVPLVPPCAFSSYFVSPFPVFFSPLQHRQVANCPPPVTPFFHRISYPASSEILSSLILPKSSLLNLPPTPPPKSVPPLVTHQSTTLFIFPWTPPPPPQCGTPSHIIPPA